MSTEDEQDRAGTAPAPDCAGTGEPIMVAYGELRRAVRAHRRARTDAAAVGRVLHVAREHEQAARASVAQAQAALVWALAVAPAPRP
ncbi:hypothetical protein [Cellulomonas hominis]|uniref:hypothetical protein n=1 Tax=Cellulomonas hominis TaxID=156981 RepID=UPI001B9F75BB|nr:hypothetical protein [Cellulomonas hominis]VTR75400.1 hypothetical protein CHMI_00144 [Cellulomonas hominis]